MKVDMWVGVVCANVVRRQWPSFDTLNVVRRQWAILWYIVVWNLSCGVMYLGPLGFSRYYQLSSLIYCQWWNGWANYSSDIWNLVFLFLLWTIWMEGINLLLKMWNAQGSIACNLQQFLIWVVLCFQVLQIVILLNHSKSHYIWK